MTTWEVLRWFALPCEAWWWAPVAATIVSVCALLTVFAAVGSAAAERKSKGYCDDEVTPRDAALLFAAVSWAPLLLTIVAGLLLLALAKSIWRNKWVTYDEALVFTPPRKAEPEDRALSLTKDRWHDQD